MEGIPQLEPEALPDLSHGVPAKRLGLPQRPAPSTAGTGMFALSGAKVITNGTVRNALF